MLQGPEATIIRGRKLRKAMSLPEVLVWRELRQRPAGLKFRRQHPSGPYVADFYCHESRLIVEIDGMTHDMGEAPERDAARDAWFAARRIKVLRVPAREVLQDLNAVVEGIVAMAGKSSPVGGGGRRKPVGGVSSSQHNSTSPYGESVTPLHPPASPGGSPPPAGEDFSRAPLE